MAQHLKKQNALIDSTQLSFPCPYWDKTYSPSVHQCYILDRLKRGCHLKRCLRNLQLKLSIVQMRKNLEFGQLVTLNVQLRC